MTNHEEWYQIKGNDLKAFRRLSTQYADKRGILNDQPFLFIEGEVFDTNQIETPYLVILQYDTPDSKEDIAALKESPDEISPNLPQLRFLLINDLQGELTKHVAYSDTNETIY